MGGFGAEPGPNRVPEKVWEALVQSQVKFSRICGRLTHGKPAEVFPAFGFVACFRKICKIKTLRLLGTPQKLIIFFKFRTSASWNVHSISKIH